MVSLWSTRCLTANRLNKAQQLLVRCVVVNPLHDQIILTNTSHQPGTSKTYSYLCVMIVDIGLCWYLPSSRLTI